MISELYDLFFYYIHIYDLFLAPVFIFIMIKYANYIQNKEINIQPEYKYFKLGLMLKIIGCFGVIIIYCFYYQSGDTFGYHRGNEALVRLFFRNPFSFLNVIFGPTSVEKSLLFDFDTGFIPPYWNDKNAFFVNRITATLGIIGLNSYVLTSLLVCFFSYFGIWKLYLLFNHICPGLRIDLAIACFFVPSVLFWGSGLGKDTITLSSIGWFSYSFYYFFIVRRNILKNFLILFISSYIILSIKSYILAALIPSCVLWVTFSYYHKIKIKLLKVLIIPVTIASVVFFCYLLFENLKKELGIFSLDTVLEHAVVVNRDLKQDYYEGTSFDIGDFEPTLQGVIPKIPNALAATYFRPYIWEVRSPVILFSSLEGIFLMIVTIKVFFTVGFFNFFRIIIQNPILIFSVSYAIIFGFSVGLTTSNFGSLARYKIPCLIFYLASLYIIRYYFNIEKRNLKRL